MSDRPLASCVLCGLRSHGPLDKATTEELNANILKGEIIIRNRDGHGVCFVCARAVVRIEACAVQWLMPESTFAATERLRVLLDRLYSLKQMPGSTELLLLHAVTSNLTEIETAMDREEAKQKADASKESAT